MPTFLVYDEIYLAHETGAHPENAQRLARTITHLKKSPLWSRRGGLTLLKPRPAITEEVSYIHSPAYIKSVESLAKSGGGMLDADTVVSERSYAAALFAVGGVLTAIDAVMKDSGNGFCLVRPPGHHARPNYGMGFCLFNNVAIGARYLQKKYKLQKMAIIDWDLHHGNGTQEAFYEDETVFYTSLHRAPAYPGTGSDREKGAGKGTGFTLNFPLGYHEGRTEFLAKFEQAIEAVRIFRPDFILISAGFDTYKDDPLGGLDLEIDDYRILTEPVLKLAGEICGGRVVSVLEGGYNLSGLPLCIEAHLKGLME